ncbi:Protein broad-minded [Apodemus speciosus]|uniref:Protein broad-minded n=1 Tax=Apodemus speciosus TaxID=105296 RepID=A0ABQ0F792_APOSI
MAHFSSEDEVMLQAMLRQLFQSVKEKITGAPSLECAEEILLRLEETDENFHNYEFVKYLRQHICNTLGSMIEEEMEKCTSDQNQGEESGYDTVVQHVTKRTQESKEYKEMMHSLKSIMMVVVESMMNKFEDDETRSQDRQRKAQKEQSGSCCTDNCSDSDSSFNQSYKFCQGKLQLILDQLDPGQPKEHLLHGLSSVPGTQMLDGETDSCKVRYEALQTLCSAPPSDVLSCENWTTLCEKLTTSLSDPDPMFTRPDFEVLRTDFYSLTVTHDQGDLYKPRENHLPTLSSGVDITSPNVTRLLKKVRLLNEYQKEAPSFWIRHPEKYMEEIVESTLSLLSVRHEQSHLVSQKILDPIYFFALVDTKAVWFKKWMHAYYSRTAVLRLLEKKYKCLITTAVQQCVQYLELCEAMKADEILGHSKHCGLSIPHKSAGFVYSTSLLFTKLSKDDICHVFRCNYSPASMVTDVLQTLCDQKECAVECLYNSTVTEALLQPIHNLMKGTAVGVTEEEEESLQRLTAPDCSETALIHIADILARIASVEEGLILLLYGENMNSSEEESGAHIIAKFSKKLLEEDISIFSGSEMLPVVKGAFISVCRQIYGTCEGLQVLLPYGLHDSIAKAWKKTSLLSERIPTPVEGSDSVSSVSQESPNSVAWEDNLLDDLLNFAATPKGLLLLQRTGAISECVTFMFSQYAKKPQVNRQKKFGYEVLVVQVASTAAGAVALQNSGFISTLITELWSNLECGRDDVRLTHPRATPVDPIDRSCQKSFLALVNLLSYPAVYELTGNQELPNKAEYSLREVPTCIIDIIDRLIVLNSEAKIRSLLNYEQSHTFGLRLLSVVCCDLDALLLLEAQYQVSNMLLHAQEENTFETSENHRNFIIDGLSVERNHVLVRINLIGGPLERILPPRMLEKNNDIGNLLSCFKMSDKQTEWIENCRRQFCKAMKSEPDAVCGNALGELLEKFVLLLTENPSECYFPSVEYTATDANVKNESLSSVQQLGIKMTVSMCLQGNYPGHDWFVSSLFIIMLGDKEKTLHFLQPFSRLLTSAFLWVPRLHNSRYLPVDTLETGIHPIYFCSAHYIEMLLKAEVPLVFSAFHMSGFAPSQETRNRVSLYSPGCPRTHSVDQAGLELRNSLASASQVLGLKACTATGGLSICLQWITQCFWNYLDWIEICHYIATCVVLGPDYQVYVCIAILRHLQRDILQHTQTQDLQVFLKEEALRGFRVSSHFEYMEILEQNYRPVLLQDMRNIRAQST